MSVSYTHLDVYKRQVQRLNMGRVDYMKDLPCAVNVDDYFDDTTVDNKHLPCDVIDIVDEYDDEIITCLVMTNNTKGDWTKITNIDKFYDLTIRSNPVNCYGIMKNTDLKEHYIQKGNIMYVNKN